MRNVITLIILALFIKTFSQEIKVPEVTFPIEITTEKLEKKPALTPPDKVEFKEKIKIKLFVEDVKPIPPYSVKPPILNLKKPSAFLGIPKENALMAEAIEQFNRGNYLFAKEKITKLIKEFPNSKFKTDAYYLGGLILYYTGDKKETVNFFEKACFSDSLNRSKDYACISAVILNLSFYKIKDAQKDLKNINIADQNALFWHSVVFSFIKPKEALKLIKDINCENLDLNFIDYCRYMKGYTLFANRKFEESLKLLSKIDSPDYHRHLLLLKGFIYLNTKQYPEALAYFTKFLEGYGSVEKVSDYAIYGIGIVQLESGQIKKSLETAGVLESRNPELAQNLYIKIAEKFADQKDFKTAFSILQRSAISGNRYTDYLRKKLAVTAYNTGNYQYAYLMFKEIKEPLFYLYAGYSLLKLKKPVEAAKFFEKAQELAADEKVKIQALRFLSDIYFRMKKFREYLLTVKKIKEYDPQYASDLLGWFFFVKKDYKKAFEAFKDPYMKAVSAFNANLLDEAYQIVKNKKDRKSRFLLAYIYLKQEKLQQARQILKELSEGNDKIAQEAGYLHAYSFFSQGEYEKAAEHFRVFAQKYRETTLGKHAVMRLADCYYNMGDIERARRIYESFIKKYANSPEAIDAAYQLTVLEMKGQEGDIPQQIESFIKKYPNYPLVNLLKVQLADYYLEKKEFDKAQQIYQQIKDAEVKESEYALYKLGYLYWEKGEAEKAVETLNEYIKKYPDGEFIINAKTLLVKIYEKSGDIDRAISVLKTLPETDENRYRLAVLYYKKGDLTDAKSYFEDIYTRFPKYRNDIAYYLGKIQLELGDYQLAMKYLQEAVGGKDYFHAAESYFLLGVIHQRNGEKEKALNSYVNVIYLYPEAKEFVIKARLKAAEIMKEEGQKKEASCMLKPLKDVEMEEKLEKLYKKLKKDLPECR